MWRVDYFSKINKRDSTFIREISTVLLYTVDELIAMNWTRPEATKKLAKVNYILNILAHWHFSAKLFSFHLKSSLQNCDIKAPSVGWFWPYGLAHTFLGIKLFL